MDKVSDECPYCEEEVSCVVTKDMSHGDKLTIACVCVCGEDVKLEVTLSYDVEANKMDLSEEEDDE